MSPLDSDANPAGLKVMVKHDEICLLKAAYESNAEEHQTEDTDSKLIVPYTGEMQAADAHLIRLARFLGIHCEPLRLNQQIQEHAEYIERAVPDQNVYFVINPQVM
jgi:hypothetical protein